MHYFQWNIKTYRADTAHLSDAEDLAYRRLIEHYYDTECPIDANALQSLCRRLRLAMQVVESILSEFFQLTEEGWRHPFIDAEIAKFHSKSASAKASAEARWMRTHSNRKPNAKQSQSEGNANQELITNNKEPITKPPKAPKGAVYSEQFESFWKAYPSGVRGKPGKGAAFKAWQKAKPSLDEILKALEWQRESDQWTREGGQYIPNPQTYLNQSRWQDDLPDETFGKPKGKPWYISGWSAIVAKGKEAGIVETRDLYGPTLKAEIFRHYGVTADMERAALMDWTTTKEK
jgi:uncharacterized protein YdaU (DUF1376 family)